MSLERACEQAHMFRRSILCFGMMRLGGVAGLDRCPASVSCVPEPLEAMILHPDGLKKSLSSLISVEEDCEESQEYQQMVRGSAQRTQAGTQG